MENSFCYVQPETNDTCKGFKIFSGRVEFEILNCTDESQMLNMFCKVNKGYA